MIFRMFHLVDHRPCFLLHTSNLKGQTLVLKVACDALVLDHTRYLMVHLAFLEHLEKFKWVINQLICIIWLGAES